MPTVPGTITALPTPPSRDDSANFTARADAFLGALPTFRTETNSVATTTYNNAVEVSTNTSTVASNTTLAVNSANSAAASAGAAAWVSGTTYALGAVVWSPANGQIYRRLIAGAGTTDPSADGTNWTNVYGFTFSGNNATLAGNLTLSGGTANGVLYLNGSKVATSGSALTFDGTDLTATGTSTFGSSTEKVIINRLSDFTAYGLITFNGAFGSATGAGIYGRGSGGDSGSLYYNVPTGAAQRFQVNGDTKLIIDSSGNVGIGSTSLTQFNFRLSNNITGNASSQAIRADGTIQSGVTTEAVYVQTRPSTVAASFTLTDLASFAVTQGTFGASSAVTNQYGFRVDSSLTGATNNYGFYSNIASGSNRWNFYAAGTAANYFAGRTDVANTRIEASNSWNGPLIDGTTEVTVADGATITLTSSLCAAVIVHVYDGGTGNGGVFFGTYSTTVTKIAGDGEATDTGSTFAVYKSAGSHTMTFKNKYGGAARSFRIAVFAANAST